jgi:hypothetical protein
LISSSSLVFQPSTSGLFRTLRAREDFCTDAKTERAQEHEKRQYGSILVRCETQVRKLDVLRQLLPNSVPRERCGFADHGSWIVALLGRSSVEPSFFFLCPGKA